MFRVLRVVIGACLGAAPNALAQPAACPASPDTLQSVAHEFWAAYNRRDLAALDRVLDDQLLFVGVQGVPAIGRANGRRSNDRRRQHGRIARPTEIRERRTCRAFRAPESPIKSGTSGAWSSVSTTRSRMAKWRRSASREPGRVVGVSKRRPSMTRRHQRTTPAGQLPDPSVSRIIWSGDSIPAPPPRPEPRRTRARDPRRGRFERDVRTASRKLALAAGDVLSLVGLRGP